MDQFHFTGKVVEHFLGTMAINVIFLPVALHKRLPLKDHPRLRIEIDINGHSFSAAWQPAGGRWYVMLGKRLLKQTGLSLGKRADVAFRVVDQDSIDLPIELERLIAMDLQLTRSWAELTTGRKRGAIHMINSAKREETRRKRIELLIDDLRAGLDPLRKKSDG